MGMGLYAVGEGKTRPHPSYATHVHTHIHPSPLCCQAPEIFWETHRHGVPSEAYSLGVLLHELSTGHRPYPSDIWERLHHHGDESAYWRNASAAADASPPFKSSTAAAVVAASEAAGAAATEMRALVKQLLKARPEDRGVGAGEGGLGALKVGERRRGGGADVGSVIFLT